MTMDIRV